MKKTCLVTGGAGFIGHHLVRHILQNTDWDVIVLDNIATPQGFRRLREVAFFPNGRLQVFTHDISLPITLGLQDEFPPINYIAHLAAESHVDYSYLYPERFVSSNITGTLNILEFSRNLPSLEKFLYFSTDEVFGPAKLGEIFHEESRHNPTNPYAATKSAAEGLATAWGNSYEIPVVVSHCCNAYGERQGHEKFIPKILASLLFGHPLTIHVNSEGVSGSRMYAHAEDISSAVVLMLTKGEPFTKYNIPGSEVSNLHMARILADIMNCSLSAKMETPYRERPGWDFRYDISGTRLLFLGWRPIVTLSEGLKRLADWYNKGTKCEK